MSKLSRIISHLAAEGIMIAKSIYDEYKLKKVSLPFLRNRVVVYFSVLNFLAVGFNFFYIYLSLQTKEGLIPLHYNIYFGVDLIGKPDQILKLPFVAFFVFIINFILAKLIYTVEKYISYILVSVSLWVSIILMVATFFILSI